MNFNVAASGNEEKLALSECFTHDEAIENYRLFLGYFTNRREYKFEDIPPEFSVFACTVAVLLDFHYEPQRFIHSDVFKHHNATDICEQITEANAHRKDSNFYHRATDLERQHLDLFVDLLKQWVQQILPPKKKTQG